VIAQDLIDLRNTARGTAAASTYQKRVARIIGTVYWGELVDGILEAEITSGRRRVDIVFRNVAVDGFFAELSQVRGISAPRVWIECKNYAKKIGNPEIDQLAGRLSLERGMFGILACRSTDDHTRLSARTTDIWRNDKKAIVVLTDDDLVELGRASIEGNRLAADAVLRRQLDQRING
jgi:hypothetical protein